VTTQKNEKIDRARRLLDVIEDHAKTCRDLVKLGRVRDSLGEAITREGNAYGFQVIFDEDGCIRFEEVTKGAHFDSVGQRVGGFCFGLPSWLDRADRAVLLAKITGVELDDLNNTDRDMKRRVLYQLAEIRDTFVEKKVAELNGWPFPESPNGQLAAHAAVSMLTDRLDEIIDERGWSLQRLHAGACSCAFKVAHDSGATVEAVIGPDTTDVELEAAAEALANRAPEVAGTPKPPKPDPLREKKLFGLMLTVVSALMQGEDPTVDAARRLGKGFREQGLTAVIETSLGGDSPYVEIAAHARSGDHLCLRLVRESSVAVVSDFARELDAMAQLSDAQPRRSPEPRILEILHRIRDGAKGAELSWSNVVALSVALSFDDVDLDIKRDNADILIEAKKGGECHCAVIHGLMLPRHLKRHARAIAELCGDEPSQTGADDFSRILIELREIQARVQTTGDRVTGDAIDNLRGIVSAIGWGFEWERESSAFGAHFDFTAKHGCGDEISGTVHPLVPREVLETYARQLAEPTVRLHSKPEPEPEVAVEVEPGGLDAKIERLGAELQAIASAIALLRKHPEGLRGPIDYLQETIDDHCEEMGRAQVERAVLELRHVLRTIDEQHASD